MVDAVEEPPCLSNLHCLHCPLKLAASVVAADETVLLRHVYMFSKIVELGIMFKCIMRCQFVFVDFR